MKHRTIHRGLKRTALALALGVCVAGTVQAQSNITGSIFGQAPGMSGATVVVENVDSGLTRTIPVDADGRYRLTSLPNGRYKVTLQKDGQPVAVRENVTVSIASGTDVSFNNASGTPNDGTTTLGAVTVVGASVPTIDVSQTDTRSVFTAEELQKISIGRTITDVAMLAPSVVASNSYSGVPSFGGSAASENAYFINGYNVTNPLTNISFSTLPFDAIGEQQVLTGGYGAEFGRSTGGVINVVTKRGTNEWKGGVYAVWTPEGSRAAVRDTMFPDTGYFPVGAPVVDGQTVTPNNQLTLWTDGTVQFIGDHNLSWSLTSGAWVSGPLVKDRLFVYADYETTTTEGTSVLSSRTATAGSAAQKTGWNEYKNKYPRWAVKFDWNITDNHLLELTGVSDESKTLSKRYAYDYVTDTHGNVQNGGATGHDDAKLYVAKYTGYLTDALTLSAMYGKQDISHNDSLPFGYNPDCPRIVRTSTPTAIPVAAFNGCQVSNSTALPTRQPEEHTKGWRLDVAYQLGDHEIRLGYDRFDAEASIHTRIAGGIGWTYNKVSNGNTAIDSSNGALNPNSAPAPGPYAAAGYYVQKVYNVRDADPGLEQSAQYIEDRWQVTDRFLLSLGLRNEQFTNFDGIGRPYISQRHQLAPRVGFSWDMRGDSTFKLFGNAGRYHLATPNNAAVRGAAASLNASEYFTYTGVNPDGSPTGLSPIAVNRNTGSICPGTNLVSSNQECGVAPDPILTTARNLKSHFQDEYIIGFEHAYSETFNWGMKATYRDLKHAIDDVCGKVLFNKCVNANPGESNTVVVRNPQTGEYSTVTITPDNWSPGQVDVFGRPLPTIPKLKRRYYAIDLFTEHPFGDKWYGKFEYTFSRNWGNTEGQLASELDTGAGGQSDVGRTQDWDLPQLMVGSNGVLPNHRKHQIKAYGYYQWNEEWRTGLTFIGASGRPRNCTSHYPTADAGLYSGAAYWYCGFAGNGRPDLAGQTNPDGSPRYVAPASDYAISPRGSHGIAPWTLQFNANVAYVPKWADGKLQLQMDVINLFNRQVAGFYNPRFETATRNRPNPLYGQELNYSAPRYVRFTARYDF
ncbi:TonB-dependent receptor [Pseudoxanthomonas helianthi]|uniref:TonB-dependent receptor n=1 Tax=Pseudoxanthomonas helianthi TaxID=1453541 RepID=A0A940X691_9GAMM|nr:TonB-dependent receptor [Pseudoxanthomonas helianthi]MBP3985717.1 TonB-dependent receptor [Pseudoxanthomonas helianthi]